MLKTIGFVALGLVNSASSSVFAQQPDRSSNPAISGKPAAKPRTRAIVVQESEQKPVPTPPPGAPASDERVVAAPPLVAAKPAEVGPPSAIDKAAVPEKPPIVVKKPRLKEKPLVRARPPQYRPRYGYGGY
jgi:hypothetical protein